MKTAVPVSGKSTRSYRVSTQRQGRSGLGIDAQKKAVPDFLDGGPWSLVAAFEEHETGRDNDRPKLRDAMALCRVRNATPVPWQRPGDRVFQAVLTAPYTRLEPHLR